MHVHYTTLPPIGTRIQSGHPGRGSAPAIFELVRIEPAAPPHHTARAEQVGQPRLHWTRISDGSHWCSPLAGALWRRKPAKAAR